MTEPLRINNSNNNKAVSFPKAFIMVLLLLLVTEICVRVNKDQLFVFTERVVQYKKELLLSDNKLQHNAIIVGDSRAMGVDALHISKAVSAGLNKPFSVFNFALPNHGLQGYYFFLKKYLSKHEKPEYIIFLSSPASLTVPWLTLSGKDHISTEFHRFAMLNSIGDCHNETSLEFLKDLLRVKFERSFYLWNYRGVIQSKIKNRIDSDDGAVKTVKKLSSTTNGGVNMGVGPMPTIQEIVHSPVYQRSFRLNKDSLFWYERFLKLAHDHEIQIILGHAPVIEQVAQKRVLDGFDASYKKLLVQLGHKYNNINDLQDVHTAWHRSLYNDPQHLNYKGDQQFSKWLGIKILSAVSANLY